MSFRFPASEFNWTGTISTFAIICALSLSACTPPQEKAAKELGKRGIAVSSASVVSAAKSGDVSLLQLLQTAGVRLSDPVAPGTETPLIAALKHESPAVDLLLSTTSQAQLDGLDETGRSALSYAVSQGNEKVALKLLNDGAHPEKTAHPASDLISDAIRQGKPEMAKSLISHSPQGAPMLQAALATAVAEADGDLVALLLNHQAPPAALGANGLSVLGNAAQAGDLAIVDLLVKHGARADLKEPNALSHAVERNNMEMAALLVQAGFSPITKSADGMSPFVQAAKLHRIPMVEFFLAKGANPNELLDSALASNDAALLDLLVKHGVDLNLPDAQGNPPLVHAVLTENLELAKYLQGQKVNLEAVGKLGQTAFGLALVTKQTPMIELLLDAGMNPNATFNSPPKPAFLEMVENEYFKNWLQKDQLLTPLMLAASRGDVDMLRLLMKRGAKRGSQTKSWKRYPVNFACETANIPAAQLLLGQDPDSKRDTKVLVSLSKQRATIYKEGKAVRSTNISTGRSGFSTPAGKYVISDKQTDWKSSIYKVPMPWFMRLSCRDFGLHQGVVTGRPASHGCVRLPKEEAQAFFGIMQIGDPVIIEN